ncbi:hypothetical protein TVAG_391800 [Trichomonas vaginalis G3]|uniref:Uncharacterized protein n=1 Tax=Trichomonas vaginalis (strain ATCC PRA-98 / G3) TaxID=412133 RepID=A2DFU3_TRIV3|nr:hypothetical protein TVAGG3_0322580 [Trichomonas vaginalis G3]EAY20796.1 hypothetical protein TVAG_391800 [Trichomonas vaginalis G3]KAI5529410.1 hypothetical protein TVAGG3_0322580 [Trichomonas vaginalis G3]|eukprot:XP_001581782.1 hypothetical protein [Trichomonas vaginalis G3]
MSARSAKTANSAAGQSLGLFDSTPEPIDVQFHLRECPFISFKKRLDLSSATIYDLMYTVSKHHGGTVSPEEVHVFIKENEDNYKPIEDFTIKLSTFQPKPGTDEDADPDVNILEFYYDFTPISGSLLKIPKLDNKN